VKVAACWLGGNSLKCLHEFICDGYASIDDAGIGYEPIAVGIGGNIGPFIGIGVQVE
jgi:hypothetical protein